MRIVEDTRQQIHGGDKHAMKHEWWAAHGVDVVRRALPFGDYIAETDNGAPIGNVSIDTKMSLAELSGDCYQDHERFRRELQRAADAGYRLYILTETGRCANLDDMGKVSNVHPEARGVKPLPGESLAKACKTMELRYGVRFLFCRKNDTASEICRLLGVDYE